MSYDNRRVEVGWVGKCASGAGGHSTCDQHYISNQTTHIEPMFVA